MFCPSRRLLDERHGGRAEIRLAFATRIDSVAIEALLAANHPKLNEYNSRTKRKYSDTLTQTAQLARGHNCH